MKTAVRQLAAYAPARHKGYSEYSRRDRKRMLTHIYKSAHPSRFDVYEAYPTIYIST